MEMEARHFLFFFFFFQILKSWDYILSNLFEVLKKQQPVIFKGWWHFIPFYLEFRLKVGLKLKLGFQMCIFSYLDTLFSISKSDDQGWFSHLHFSWVYFTYSPISEGLAVSRLGFSTYKSGLFCTLGRMRLVQSFISPVIQTVNDVAGLVSTDYFYYAVWQQLSG